MSSAKVTVLFLIAISIACSFASNKRDVRSASTSTSSSTESVGRRSASTSTSSSTESVGRRSASTSTSSSTESVGRRSASTSTSTSTSSSSSSSTEGAADPGLQGLIEGFAQECVGDACVPLDGVAVEVGDVLVDPPVIDAGEPAQ